MSEFKGITLVYSKCDLYRTLYRFRIITRKELSQLTNRAWDIS